MIIPGIVLLILALIISIFDIDIDYDDMKQKRKLEKEISSLEKSLGIKGRGKRNNNFLDPYYIYNEKYGNSLEDYLKELKSVSSLDDLKPENILVRAYFKTFEDVYNVCSSPFDKANENIEGEFIGIRNDKLGEYIIEDRENLFTMKSLKNLKTYQRILDPEDYMYILFLLVEDEREELKKMRKS